MPLSGRGYTLLELLVVVAIIGLLAAYVGPRYVSQLGKSEVTAARTQIEAIARALESYRLDNGSYPLSEVGLTALRNRPANQKTAPDNSAICAPETDKIWTMPVAAKSRTVCRSMPS